MISYVKLLSLLATCVSADLGYTDSYGAPYAPSYDSYSAPTPPVQQYDYNQQNVDHNHVHHHYYHASQPIVKVPVTHKPYVVKVPQNVPVKFVPVNVPTQAPQFTHLPVQYAPAYGYHLQGQYDDGFVKRKELIKSALLLGAGVVKGAVITTLINQAQGNGK